MKIELETNEDVKWFIKSIRKKKPKKGTELTLIIGDDVTKKIPFDVLPDNIHPCYNIPANSFSNEMLTNKDVY